jgi:DNA-directed RNA polymerase subunit RPC12/RpoP
MKSIDVTKKVNFGWIDDESLPITKCICGHEFEMWCGDLTISIYKDDPTECPNCGAKLYFSNEIRIYQVIE